MLCCIHVTFCIKSIYISISTPSAPSFQMPSSSIESDFDDRFLRCFGLGESDSSVKNLTNSQSELQEREDKLRIQAEESPWLTPL